eukprot:gene9465-1671_t
MNGFEQQQQAQQQQKESFDHLPINERLKHKSYDARKHGVEEIIKKFKEETEFTGGSFSQFEDFLPLLVADKNVLVAEKSLEAVKLWLENYSKYSITSKDIIPVLVEKSLGAPKTKKSAIELLLLFIEYELVDVVINELVKGFEHKTPKIRQTSVEVIKEAVIAYGIPVVPVKNFIQPLMKLFDDKNAPVRKEVTNLTVELYKWIKDGIKPFISNLRPAQLKDLEKSFQGVDEQPTATRFLKSYVPPAAADVSEDCEDEDVEIQDAPVVQIELPGIEILSKIKREWFGKMMEGVDPNYKGTKEEEPKPFKVRQDALKELNELLVDVEKLESGDYSNVISHVLKTCSEPQILVAQSGLEAVDHLLRGLKSEFSSYTGSVIPVVVPKFKEKRSQILKLIHSILTNIDAHCKPFTEFLDVLSEGLKNKAPNMREQIMVFIDSCLKKNSKDTQKHVKVLIPMIYQQFENANPAVRNMASKVFGRLMFSYDKESKPYFNKLDAQKQKKITDELQKLEKESPAKAPVNQKKRTATVMQEKPAEVAPKKQKVQKEAPSSSRKLVKKVVKRSVSAPKKQTIDRDMVSINPRYSAEDAEEKYNSLVSQEIRSGFNEKKWEVRCQAFDELSIFIEKLQGDKKLDSNAELLIHMLQVKPSWKEANVNILVKMTAFLKKLVESTEELSGFVAVSIMDFVLLKLATAKLREALKENLMAISTAISPQFVFNEVMKRLQDIKSPTVIIEILSWTTEAIDDFGINLFKPKAIIDQMKKYIDNTNVKIKKASISVLCTLKKYVGDSLLAHFNDIKPALLSLLKDECAKVEQVSKVIPKRKVRGAEESKEEISASINSDEARVDINPQITEHLKNLDSHQWKNRAEGIESIEKIVESTGGQITANIGSLIQSLKKRLDTEVNLKITASTIQLINKIASAVGPSIQKFSPVLLPSLVPHIVSNKPDVRKHAVEAVESWVQAGGSFSLKYFGHVLAQDKGALEGKKEILTFILDQFDLLQLKEPEYIDIKPIINCLDSSSNEVKKSAETTILKLISLTGLTQMKYISKDAKPSVASQLSAIFKKGVEIKQQGVESPQEVKESTFVRESPKEEVKVIELFELLPNSEKATREKNQAGNPWILEDSMRQDLYLLVSQQSEQCFSSSLHKLLFSTDASNNLSGLSKMKDLFKSMEKEMIDSLDVILKYCSFQLFDSKLSIKECSLSIILDLFQQLKAQKYILSDYESNIILPLVFELTGHHINTIREKSKLIVELSIDISSRVAFHLLNSLSSTNSLTRHNILTQMMNFLNEKSLDIFTIVQNELFNKILICLDDSEKIKTSLSRVLKIIYSIIGTQMFSYLKVTEFQKEIIEECVRNVKMVQKSTQETEVKKVTPVKVKEEKPSATFLKLVNYSELDDLFKSPVERDSFMVLLRSIDPKVETEEDIENEIVSLKKLINVFQSKDNSIIIHLKEIVTRTSVYFAELIQSNTINFRFCKYILSTLLVLFGNRQFVELMAIEDLQRLIHININSIVNDELIVKVQDGNQLIKGMNTLIGHIMENSDNTYVFSAMIKLLLHTTQQEIKGKYIELLIKCILKLTKDFSTTISKIDIDIILLEFHEFLTLYPPTVLREKSDLALRTIKTTLNEIVKLKGPTIRTHLSLIPTHKSPVIVTYIEMMLKTTKTQTPQKSMRKSKIPSKLQTVPQDKELDDIFVAIQNPDTTSSGIYRLYKFIVDHPNVDFKSSHLSKCSQVFQDYILRQLEKTKNLELEANKMFVEKKTTPLEITRARRKLSTIDNSTMDISKVKSPSKFETRRSTLNFTNETTTTDLASIKSRLMALGDEKENLTSEK